MPEYLTPGVYLEETSFRSRSIEGVPTSTFGMAGLTRYGPLAYQLTDPKATMVDKPVLVTTFTEFERAFGGLEDVGGDVNYLAYAARAFFDNGGHRLYVSRVFSFATKDDGAGHQVTDVDANFAKLELGAAPAMATWRARWPGEAGKTISMQVGFRRSKNRLVGTELRGVAPGAAVEIFDNDNAIPRTPFRRRSRSRPTSGSWSRARARRSCCARTTAPRRACPPERCCATSRST